jgi:hypothetical protein
VVLDGVDIQMHLPIPHPSSNPLCQGTYLVVVINFDMLAIQTMFQITPGFANESCLTVL